MKTKNVTGSLTVEIPILEDMQDGFSPNVGALTLSLGERNFILDTVQTYHNEDRKKGGTLSFDVKLLIDKDTFPDGEEYNYNLTEEDLENPELKAEYYCVIDDTGSSYDEIDMDNAKITGIIYVDEKEFEINVILE